MSEQSMVEIVARALEPKFRGFGSGDLPMNVAREVARAAIEAIAMTLCRAVANNPAECPFCENGKCQPKMWTAFRSEAAAVERTLLVRGVETFS